jgi:hypothetical protein
MEREEDQSIRREGQTEVPSPTSQLTPEQIEFAEFVGRLIAARWDEKQNHSTSESTDLDRSARGGLE